MGLPLTHMMRFGECQYFDFGDQRPSAARKGRETTTTDFRLVTELCRWRIAGPDGFVLDSEIHFGTKRDDGHANTFYDLMEAAPLRVGAVDLNEAGKLSLCLSSGHEIVLTPRLTAARHPAQWMFLRPSDALFLEGSALLLTANPRQDQ